MINSFLCFKYSTRFNDDSATIQYNHFISLEENAILEDALNQNILDPSLIELMLPLASICDIHSAAKPIGLCKRALVSALNSIIDSPLNNYAGILIWCLICT